MTEMAILVRLCASKNLKVFLHLFLSLHTHTLCVAVCCCVLLCVAVCCCVLQCGVVWCSVLLCVAMWCYALQWSLWQKAPKYLDISLYVLQWVRCSLLQRVGMLQCVAMYCSDLFCKRAPWIVRSLVECVVVYYNVLQYHSCSVLQCVAVCCSDLFCNAYVCVCAHLKYRKRERDRGILPPMQLYVVRLRVCLCDNVCENVRLLCFNDVTSLWHKDTHMKPDNLVHLFCWNSVEWSLELSFPLVLYKQNYWPVAE